VLPHRPDRRAAQFVCCTAQPVTHGGARYLPDRSRKAVNIIAMSNVGDAAAAALRHPIAKGWFVHCVTASGAICGMLGIIAVSDKQPREAVLWLAVAMVLDGVD